ncbi:pilus assembly protein [Arthrobacter sp. I2-34]|uniref:Pilus assembly protein n=1 Tax=Arthrobacter hankyongi TaxID=2904801 RepID=A0ABS9L4L5_9MICC|nr:TadE family protein [Arthrobacter hankyongi]MCG2621615.1 pilus assembly protein [Arthrobacter hankyongi]
MKALRREHGAAAVEFALVLPILLLVVIGIAEFGRAFFTEISLAQAAREGARVMALTQDSGQATAAAITAAPGLNPVLGSGNITMPSTCTEGSQVTVTVSYSLTALTGFIGPFDLQSQGAMRCGG